MSRLEVIHADITTLDVHAIVNAANTALQGGGGVDGAIHRAAGPELVLESHLLAPCPPGQARLTKGYKLKARVVIHTVGPVWRGGSLGEADVLARAYRSSLALAEAERAADVAFPAISTGVYGYPVEEACEIAARECVAWTNAHQFPTRVIFCMFSAAATAVMQRALAQALPVK